MICFWALHLDPFVATRRRRRSSTGAPLRTSNDSPGTPDDPHFPAWRRFNRTVGTDGSVGIWHETYVVAAGHYKAIYNNMALFGLLNATEHVPGRMLAKVVIVLADGEMVMLSLPAPYQV